MAIIDPEGLFSGERLAACSDLAQLYWPRFFLAANSCGRIELSYKSLVSRVFGNFSNVPESAKLWDIFREYDKNYLAILYQTDGGTWWCQFVTSEKFLPKYKKTRDELSPTPFPEQLDAHREGYIEWKKSKSFQNQSFQKVPPSFSSEGVGIGIGEGIGIGKKQKPSPKPKAPVDPRFGLFKIDFETHYERLNGIAAPWDAKEASSLSRWLKANPTITQMQWREIMRNRRNSPINKTASLSLWIGKAFSWLNGIADEWGKPVNGGNKSNGRVENNQNNIADLLSEVRGSSTETRGNDLFPGGGGEQGILPDDGGTTIEGEL